MTRKIWAGGVSAVFFLSLCAWADVSTPAAVLVTPANEAQGGPQLPAAAPAAPAQNLTQSDSVVVERKAKKAKKKAHASKKSKSAMKTAKKRAHSRSLASKATQGKKGKKNKKSASARKAKGKKKLASSKRRAKRARKQTEAESSPFSMPPSSEAPPIQPVSPPAEGTTPLEQ